MGLLPVLALVGRMVLMFALLLLVPLAFAVGGHDDAEQAFTVSIGITAAAGLMLSLLTRRFRRELQPRDGIGTVRFFPDGASSGGRLRLAANGGGWDVDVRWVTGEVRVHRIQDAP